MAPLRSSCRRRVAVALVAGALGGCAHLRQPQCADMDAYLEFGAKLRGAPTEAERDRLLDATAAAAVRRGRLDRDLLRAILDAQTGDVAAARAALNALSLPAHPDCPATHELIALYGAYVDRLTLIAQLAEANQKIEALTDVERTMMRHDANAVGGAVQ
jgi:hypothetical protein